MVSADQPWPRIVEYDAGHLTHPDAETVDTLARAQLAARRLGREIRLRNAAPALEELLALAGLQSVLPPARRLPVEPQRQAEHREHPCGVQEEADPRDLTA